MFDKIVKFFATYIAFPWKDSSTDSILGILTTLMVICLAVGLYFGFKMERKGRIHEYLNFYTFASIFNYFTAESLFYWYIALVLIIAITAMANKLMRDEGKERYYAALHGKTYKEFQDLWYESEDQYWETVDVVNKMDMDKGEIEKYSIPNKCIKLAFAIATFIFICLVVFVGGYKVLP